MSSITKSRSASQPERFCKYIHRFCNQTRLDGYDYCIRHILEDKTAPFRQCMYVNQPNKKKCTNAAPKNDRQDSTLCPFHAKRALMKTRAFHSKRRAEEHSLEHNKPSTLEQVESFFKDGETVVGEARIENIDEEFSGVEKVGDCLEHAGVFTHKEVCTIAREKILKLQHLYCEELKVLYRRLKESRRNFLLSVAKPGEEVDGEEQQWQKLVYRDLKEVKGKLLARIEVPSTSAVSAADSTSSTIDTKVLQSLSQYHCRSGTQRIFRRRVLERRAGLSRPDKPTCSYEKNELRCMLPALVSTKFCRNHILLDPKQVLYVPCGESKCKIPVLPIDEKIACDYHFSCVLTGYRVEEDMPQPSISVLPLENSLHLMAHPEPEHFQSMDDIASLNLDAIASGSFIGLDQFGEPAESTNRVRCEDSSDLMHIQAISLKPPSAILSGSESE